MKKIIVIVGPTGVGKTKMSIELAKKLNGEIINADSMQIYKYLNIGTAKVTEQEKENIPHYLFDIKNIEDDYSVYDYQKDCREKIEEILSNNKTPILVGGTGLYIKAALFDYRFTPKKNIDNNYEELTNEEIYNKILTYQKEIDVHINNRKRLIRLLEKLVNKEDITNNKNKLLYDNVVFIGLTTEREKLYDIIDKRVDKMISMGLIEEVSKYKDLFNNSKALNTGIGYKEFYDYFYNDESLEKVIYNIKKNSRNYAKRQYTFFNNQMNVNWFTVDFDNFNNTVREVEEYLEEW